MIGIIRDEDVTVIEFNPIFAKNIKWLRIIIPVGNSTLGEYGIAWSKPYTKWSLPKVWIHWGNTGYPSWDWAIRDMTRALRRWSQK